VKNCRTFRKMGVAVLLIALCLILTSAPILAQEMPKPPERPTAESDTETKADDAEDAGKPKAEDENPNMIALNLKGANIDKILKFLSDLTGKPVMKTKDAKAEITIASKNKIPREEAIRLICEALRLEKVAVIERDNIIWLVPEAKLPELSVGLVLAPEDLPRVGVISKAIPVKFLDMAEIEKLIKPLLSKNATLIAPPGAEKIIVVDTVERVTNLEKVLAQLDVLDVDDRQVQIFQLQHADAEAVAPIITAVMASPGTGKPDKKPPKGKPAAAGGEVTVQAYKAANWLIIVSPKDKVDEIAKLVNQLDREMPQELKLRIIPVEFADADQLARQLSSVMQKRRGKRIRDTVEISANTRSNSLLVLSSETNYNTVLEVVKELDNEESVEMKTKWFELQHADADDLAEQMNDLYSGMEEEDYYYWWRPRQQKAKTRFVAERRTNSLIAIAPPNEFEKIKELIEKLDLPIDAEQVAPRIFPIKYCDAKELTDVLNKVFGVEDTSRTGGYYAYLASRYGDKSEVGRLYGKVRFDPLISTNSIIVTTNNKENFAIVEQFINDLDRTAPEAANLLVVTLKHGKAAKVAEQLNILFAREGARAPQKKEGEDGADGFYAFLFGSQKKKEERPVSNLIGRVRVVPDIRTNSLLITTAAQNHQAIKELIELMDSGTPKVYVAVRLMEIIRTKASRVGTRFSSDPSVFETDDFDNGLRSTLGFEWSEIHGNGIISAGLDISALVQFMARNYNTRILSDTSLSMNNNEEAEIFVGAEIPFPEKSTISPEGTRTDALIYRDAGTQLTIMPNINQDGKVVMNISLSAIQVREGEVLFGAPMLDKREFKTVLDVEDGQTVVMGGILREQESEGRRGVPILRHIPVINWIFGKKTKEHTVTELVAFISPNVLWTPADDIARTEKTKEGLRERHDWQPLNDDENAGPDK